MPHTADRQPTQTRQAEIVAAVLALSASQGPGTITTQGIATAIGLTHGALFKHFPTKAALWLAVIDWVDTQLMARLQAAADGHDHPVAALRAVFMAHTDFVVAHPGVPRFIFNELQQPEDSPLKRRVSDMLARYRQLLLWLLKQSASLGALRPRLDLDAAATLFIGSLQGLVMQAMLRGDTAGMRDAADTVFALYRSAIIVELTS
ncbi:MAG TPA: TetR family transcriptional regulator [Denitromonas sp.]|uniref:TetR/AcrR family transcriptional regulator n=1 Tax=Denitromonas sp. TaxID=2734609 RepID=UPI001D6FAD6E|nr:TetR/AcrR family transcriptional regulator [Rhodocyclaceae bacterium]MCP5223153.1 TetR/AcrR family transcriptional regulator [Zoogloeaceae bacterium]HPR07248.1 TetR family transcriptional regulator [Denitromonas sp.]HQV15782.1 TetR family transcriptional regulator [Denitromonas sp.]